MLKLNTEENRSLSFDVNIHNIDYKQLEGSFKLDLDGIQVGVPVKIIEDNITVEIPPLSEHIKTLKHGEVVNGILEVFGNGFYLKPWEGEFQLTSPVKVEAKVYEPDAGVDLGDAQKHIAKTLTATLSDKPVKEQNENNPADAEDEVRDAARTIKRGAKHDVLEDDDVITKKEMKEMLEDILGKKEKFTETPKPKKQLVTYISKSGKTYKVNEKVAVELRRLEEQKISKPKQKRTSEITQDDLMAKLNQLKEKKGITPDMESRLSPSGTDNVQLMESMGMMNQNAQQDMADKTVEDAGDNTDDQFDALKKMLELQKG